MRFLSDVHSVIEYLKQTINAIFDMKVLVGVRMIKFWFI